MSKLTSQPRVVVAWIALLFSAALLAHGVGYMLSEKPVRLEGSTKWCYEGEYRSVKEFQATERHARSFIDVLNSEKIRVFTPCDFEYDSET